MLSQSLFLVVLTFSIVYADSTQDSDMDGVPVDPNANRIKHRFMNCGFKTAVDLTNNQNLMNIQRLANSVVLAMNRNWNGMNSFALANVINAVSMGGTCYEITFTIGQTICQNNRFNPPNPNTCQINNFPGSYCQCTASIMEINQFQQNISYNCQKANLG